MQFKLTYYGGGLAIFVPTGGGGWDPSTTLVIHNPPGELAQQVGQTIAVEELFAIGQRVR